MTAYVPCLGIALAGQSPWSNAALSNCCCGCSCMSLGMFFEIQWYGIAIHGYDMSRHSNLATTLVI